MSSYAPRYERALIAGANPAVHSRQVPVRVGVDGYGLRSFTESSCTNHRVELPLGEAALYEAYLSSRDCCRSRFQLTEEESKFFEDFESLNRCLSVTLEHASPTISAVDSSIKTVALIDSSDSSIQRAKARSLKDLQSFHAGYVDWLESGKSFDSLLALSTLTYLMSQKEAGLAARSAGLAQWSTHVSGKARERKTSESILKPFPENLRRIFVQQMEKLRQEEDYVLISIARPPTSSTSSVSEGLQLFKVGSFKVLRLPKALTPLFFSREYALLTGDETNEVLETAACLIQDGTGPIAALEAAKLL